MLELLETLKTVGWKISNSIESLYGVTSSSIKQLPFDKRIEMWVDLLDSCEAFLLAGLKNRLGPDGDLQLAYRQWNERRIADREKDQIQFLRNLSRREATGGD